MRPTHTREELLVLATALFQSSSKAKFLHNLNLTTTNSSATDVREVVKKRMDTIGPLAREVLGPLNYFTAWKDAMENASNIATFLEMKDSADKFSLPKTAKHFIAPDAEGNLVFLSGRAMELVLNKVEEKHIQLVAQLPYAWQAAEYIVKKFCVLNAASNGSAVCSAWDFNMWEYFHNPSLKDHKLKRTYTLNHDERADLIAKITKHTHEAIFTGEGNEIIIFQTSPLDPAKHTISLTELLKWKEAVKPSKITIVFFTDWCVPTTSRVTVIDRSRHLSDQEVSERLSAQDHPVSFKSYIVRCGIYSADGLRALYPCQ